MKTKITESELSSRSASLREKIAQLESQQTDEGWFDDAIGGVKKFFGGGTQPAAAAPAAAAPAAAAPAAAATPGTPAAGVAFNQGKPGEAPQAQAQAAAGPAGAPPKPAANAREQQYNTALKQIKDLYTKAGVQYPPQDDIVRQRYGLPPALPAIAQWDGKMPQSTGADFLTRNLFGRDASKAVAGQQAANNISNTANAKSDAETEADVKELGTLVAQLKDALAGKGPTVAPVSLSQAATPGTPAAGVAFNQGKAYGGYGQAPAAAPATLAESIARLNKKIRLMETPMGQDPAQKAAAAAPPPLDTTGKDSSIQKIKDLMAKINGNNEDPPQDVAQALSDAQAAIDQFEAAAKNAPAVSLDQNNGVTTPDSTQPVNNASSSYTGAPGKAINPDTGEEYTPLEPAAANPTGPVTSKQIYDLNKGIIGANPDLIKPGQQLKMPDGSTYTVKAGDNLSKIAKQAPVDTAPVPVSANTSSSYTGTQSAAPAAAATPGTPAAGVAFNQGKAFGGYGQAPATAESVSYRDDQALARIVELSRR